MVLSLELREQGMASQPSSVPKTYQIQSEKCQPCLIYEEKGSRDASIKPPPHVGREAGSRLL